jgi:microcystin-dependent protein
VQGETSGTTTVTLLANNMPAHNHLVNAVTATTNNVGTPQNALPSADAAAISVRGETATVTSYSTAASNAQMNPAMIATAGGNVPHNNMQPYLVVNFCIAMSGLFPSRS